jgi:hypothetical protein
MPHLHKGKILVFSFVNTSLFQLQLTLDIQLLLSFFFFFFFAWYFCPLNFEKKMISDHGGDDVQQLSTVNFYKEWEVNRTSPCRLFVRNKKDEFIATLKGIGPAWWPEKLIVTNYCRDPTVLAFKPTQTSSSPSPSFFDKHSACRMRCFDDQNGLAGFSKYLRDRGKAACVDDPVNFVHYFLVAGERASDLILIRRPMRRQVAANVANRNVTTKPVVPMSKKDQQEQIEKMRQSIHDRLVRFLSAQDEDSLAFEPMNDRGRDIVMGEIAVRHLVAVSSCLLYISLFFFPLINLFSSLSSAPTHAYVGFS